jgi:hypothetical protein
MFMKKLASVALVFALFYPVYISLGYSIHAFLMAAGTFAGLIVAGRLLALATHR